MEVVLLPKGGDGFHHRGGVVCVNSRLVGPAVDQKDGFRVIQGLEVLLAQVAFFGADGIHRAAGDHFFGKRPGTSIGAGVSEVYGNGHGGFLFGMTGLQNQGHRHQDE